MSFSVLASELTPNFVFRGLHFEKESKAELKAFKIESDVEGPDYVVISRMFIVGIVQKQEYERQRYSRRPVAAAVSISELTYTAVLAARPGYVHLHEEKNY